MTSTSITNLAPRAARDIAQQAPHPLQQRRAIQSGMPGMPTIMPSPIDPPVYGTGAGPNGTIIQTLPTWRIWLHNKREWINWALMTIGLAGFIALKARR